MKVQKILKSNEAFFHFSLFHIHVLVDRKIHGASRRISPFTLFFGRPCNFLVAIIANKQAFKEEEQLRGRYQV
jgi:hypothetical protein